MKNRWDVADLLISFAIPPILWFSLLTWNPSLLIENHDGTNVFYLQARDLFARAGDWSLMPYHLGIQGGVRIHDTLGTLPLLEFLAHLGFSPATGLNLLLFAIQGSFAYLALKSATDLSSLFTTQTTTPLSLSPTHERISLASRACVVTLASFCPLIAWFLPYGHESYLLGSLVFVVIASLALSVAAQSLTTIQVLISLMVLIHAIRGSGQQAILYGFVFGAPILLGAGYDLFKRHRGQIRIQDICAALLIFIAALMIALPGYWGMLANAFGSDSARSSVSRITYSYYTSQWLDWIQSFAWTIHAIPESTPHVLYHEINYSVGPLLLIALAFPWKKARGIAIGLVFSTLLALGFSTNTFPVSNILLALIPPLEMFRVPARAMFPSVLTIILLSGSVLLSATPLPVQKKKTYLLSATAFLLAAFFAFLPEIDPLRGIFREFIAWILAGFIFTDTRTSIQVGSERVASSWRMPAIILLTGLSLHPFYERLLQRIPISLFEAKAEQIHGELLRQAPDLASPLNRIVLDFTLSPWGTNTPWALGVSSIDGYFPANRRFHDLVDASRGEIDSTGTMMNYHFGNTPAFHLLASIYNVRYRALAGPTGIQVVSTHDGNGAAWFSSTLEPSESYAELVKNLQSWNRKSAWYLRNDPALNPGLLRELRQAALNKQCSEAQVLQTDVDRSTHAVRVEVDTPTACALALSMNFNSTTEATSTGASLKVFPIYGALTGILIPAGHQIIEIRNVAQIPAWTRWAQALGALIAAIATIWVNRPRASRLLA
jgi:hypothetical protein